MKNKLTVEDKIILRSIMDTILGDDDLRNGFKYTASVREMNRVHGRLLKEIQSALEEASTPA